ncbi:MAG: hypothetical protein CL912_14880 [Deltaproteobacteria bacterium]|nr:hypothetical protein [Deltaproteobacteria bacterium]|tara:strand:- start:2133 stop:2351 length:219 start_codon:yes stop_codon:yes gene_type:complete
MRISWEFEIVGIAEKEIGQLRRSSLLRADGMSDQAHTSSLYCSVVQDRPQIHDRCQYLHLRRFGLLRTDAIC